MHRKTRPSRGLRPRTPLAACIASVFALSAPVAASATTWVVDSCVDDANSATTAGTLRYAVAHANNPSIAQLPDVVDLSGLTGPNACPNNELTLTQSTITISQSALVIKGPGAINLAIHHEGGCSYSATCDDRVLTHTGDRTVVLQDIGISGGTVYHISAASTGGCILSQGSLYLDHVSVFGCGATTSSASDYADGGAVYVKKDLTMKSSSITDSALSADFIARGGGAHVNGNASLTDSTISGNTANGYQSATGGGLYVAGTTTLASSSITTNTLQSLWINGGKAYGGGVFSEGDFTANDSTIGVNSASGHQLAIGGGVEALGKVTLDHALILGNAASAASSARAGGVDSVLDFSATDTTIDGNSAVGDPMNGTVFAGGVGAFANITLVRSTLSNNETNVSGGGIVGQGGAGKTALLQSSTISGNSAGRVVGGVFFNLGTVKSYNTTIAFNTAANGDLSGSTYAPGMALTGISSAMSVTLQSSLLSNNTYGSAEVDLSTASVDIHPITFNAGPAHNLIRSALVGSALPADTIGGACPLLGPLRDNGGVTRTHALLSTSPAIDFGSNVLGLDQDQRGSPDDPGPPFPYPRMSNGDADIGAYEVDQDEIVFNAGFDGCPDLF